MYRRRHLHPLRDADAARHRNQPAHGPGRSAPGRGTGGAHRRAYLPDVFLGLYTSNDLSQKSLAVVSIAGFQKLFNPAPEAEYSAVGASFVDVTDATGAYVPLTETTPWPSAPSGSIPTAAAADICSLTYYCQLQDVHPKTRGYSVIARLVVATLPKRR